MSLQYVVFYEFLYEILCGLWCTAGSIPFDFGADPDNDLELGFFTGNFCHCRMGLWAVFKVGVYGIEPPHVKKLFQHISYLQLQLSVLFPY